MHWLVSLYAVVRKLRDALGASAQGGRAEAGALPPPPHTYTHSPHTQSTRETQPLTLPMSSCTAASMTSSDGISPASSPASPPAAAAPASAALAPPRGLRVEAGALAGDCLAAGDFLAAAVLAFFFLGPYSWSL